MKKGYIKKLKFILGFVLLLFAIFLFFRDNGEMKGDILYSDAVSDVDNGKVETIHCSTRDLSTLTLVYKKGEIPTGYTYKSESVNYKGEEINLPDVNYDKEKDTYTIMVLNPRGSAFFEHIEKANVNVVYEKTSNFGGILVTLLGLVPTLFLVLFWIAISRSGALTLDKTLGADTKQHELEDSLKVTTFKDVAGLTEEKEELTYVVDLLKNKDLFDEMGLKLPKGILLEGAPGVGKTLLAKALAGEAGVNFLSYAGSDFVEKYVGVGAQRVRKMFEDAERNKPCIVFIDEFESLGKSREMNNGRDSESNNTITALLERMDGLQSTDGVLFVAATNLASQLDPAVTRPGRFGKIIHIDPPKTKEDREAIVRVHAKNKRFTEDLTVAEIANMCYGMTGAEIANVLNEAILEAFKRDKGKKVRVQGVIDKDSLDKAIMKQYAKGLAKGTHSKEEMKRVAIHEVGHALMNEKVGRDVIKVSVQPYSGGLGGVTQVDGESMGDDLSTTSDLMKDMEVLLAGKVAEEVMLGECSVGASNDLERATQTARNYVTVYGMKKGNLISRNILMKDSALFQYDEKLLNDIEEVLQEANKKVVDYLTIPKVKEAITKISEVLINECTIYSIKEYLPKVAAKGVKQDNGDVVKSA